MKNNYILIDYENVQPENLDALDGHPVKVKLFVGAQQAKVPLQLAASLQRLGSDAEYIQINGNGPNALDFHIAFYIGELAACDENAYFHIVSKDTGFDPLIKHLRQRKVLVQRSKTLTEIPLLKISANASLDVRIDSIVANLASRGHSRPRKVKTLANTINTLFLKTLGEPDLMGLVKELRKRGYISISGDAVSYQPPIVQG